MQKGVVLLHLKQENRIKKPPPEEFTDKRQIVGRRSILLKNVFLQITAMYFMSKKTTSVLWLRQQILWLQVLCQAYRLQRRYHRQALADR